MPAIVTDILIALLLAFQILLLAILTAYLSVFALGLVSVPWVPTPSSIGRRMFSLAQLKPGETVADLGSGDGSLIICAAREFGARGVGYEWHPALRLLARARARLSNVSDKVSFRGGSFFRAVLPPADVVATYLFPEIQARLEKELREHYQPGTRVVARAFRYPTLELLAEEEFDGEKIFLYRL